MPTIFSTLVVFLFASPAMELIPETVTFKVAKPAVGDTIEEALDRSVDMDITMSMGGQDFPAMKNIEKTKSQLTRKVAAIDGDKVTKIHFHLASYTSEQQNPMSAPATVESPATGKNFFVEDKDGTMVVTLEDGESASDEDSAAVLDRISKGLFDPRQDLEVVEGEIEVGKEIVLTEENARKLLKDDDNAMGIEKATLTLVEVKDVDGTQCGIFDLLISVKSDTQEGPMAMNLGMEAIGKLAVQVETGWISSMTIDGKMSLKASGEQGGQSMDMSGEGTTKIVQGAKFGK